MGVIRMDKEQAVQEALRTIAKLTAEEMDFQCEFYRNCIYIDTVIKNYVFKFEESENK